MKNSRYDETMDQHILPSRAVGAQVSRSLPVFKIAAITVVATTLFGCLGYVPGRQSYWDAKVREMCAKDGEVQIFEKLRVSKADLNFLSVVEGRISLPVKELAHPKAPAYAEITRTYLRQANPEVSRNEVTIVRRTDQATIARWIVYGRFGGDLPSPGHPSSFSCPDQRKILADLQELFIVEGDSK